MAQLRLNQLSVKSLAFSFIFMFCQTYFASSQAFSAESLLSSASIVKTEGNGTAKVRRKNGQEVSAGVPLNLFVGDKVITDNGSIVEILLSEGSIVRIGFNSEYKIISAEPKGSIISWMFYLAKGSIRALIEKSGDKKNSSFRVNTPAGTMGVRGTEILLEHDEPTGTTRLFVFHGLAELGPEDCIKDKAACTLVGDRQYSEIRIGDKQALKAKKFTARDLFRSQTALVKNGSSESSEKSEKQIGATEALMMGFDAAGKKAGSLERMNEDELEKIVSDSEARLQKIQNALLARDENLRKAEEIAKANGTFDKTLGLADAYLKEKGLAPATQSAPNQGLRNAQKFALGARLSNLSNQGSTQGIRGAQAISGPSGSPRQLRSSFSGSELYNTSSQALSGASRLMGQTVAQVAEQDAQVQHSLSQFEAMTALNQSSPCSGVAGCTAQDVAAIEQTAPGATTSTASTTTSGTTATTSGTTATTSGTLSHNDYPILTALITSFANLINGTSTSTSTSTSLRTRTQFFNSGSKNYGEERRRGHGSGSAR